MTIYFAFAAIACGIFYPKYFKWRYKKYHKIYIEENYSKRFGQEEIIEINSDSIFSKNKTGEAKINISEVEKIDETENHFFLKISSGLSLLIPKRELTSVDVFREKLNNIGLIVNKEISHK